MHTPLNLSQLKNPLVVLALGLGAGLAPKAPGTVGTLMALPLYFVIRGMALPQYVLVVIVLFVFGVWLCGYAARKLGVHDHPSIVFDEIVGFLITMIAVPFSWPLLLAGFVLFRFFDAVKPWPISWCDKNLHGGFGIMFDDVLAGIASAALLQCYLLWPGA
jgi:phosphatidylglycerophosphatase A